MSVLEYTPTFTIPEAAGIARELFGVAISDIKTLPSERDQNFLLTDQKSCRFVFKISCGTEQRAFLESQNILMQHLADQVCFCPRVLPTLEDQLIGEVRNTEGRTHLVRMVTFIEGVPMAELPYHAPELHLDLGCCIGQLDTAMEGFDHPSFHRSFPWDLAEAKEVINARIHLISDTEQRSYLEYFLKQYEQHTTSCLTELPRSVIHNDANDGNLVVHGGDSNGVHFRKIAGIIDFGDTVYSWTVSNLAVAVAYAILDKTDPLNTASEIIRGYHSKHSLSEAEIEAIFGLVCMRLSVSVVMAAEQQQARPDDPYLGISQAPIRRTMQGLVGISYGFATAVFRVAAGFTPLRKHRRICEWIRKQAHTFDFPIPIESKTKQIHVLDLGVESSILGSDDAELSEPKLTRLINNDIEKNNARIGVGRYLEHRLFYTTEQFCAGADQQEERRTVHLGIDLFDKADTEVRAPLSGFVHLVEEIDKPLDYGTVVILRHETTGGEVFFTLYGHLARITLRNLKIGQSVQKGETIARLGTVEENGGWTPHLHFQLILDLLDFGHDFPGVGQASRIEVWSALSPDPNCILRIPDELFPVSGPKKDQTRRKRDRLIGSNLSIGYQEPIKVVRGWMQYLYDESGRKYIDAYNNVPHVGHGHPEVVEAALRQMKLLNTNTRYLSDLLNDFADRLVSTMPDPLKVCYILNSASEANELALRLARAYTGHKDIIVTEAAYHGNTTTLIDISPYKHCGPGGQGAPDWVHVVPLADVFRGRFRDPATAGAEYASQVGDVVEWHKSKNRNMCGFIAESCPSVGGQILFPEGYLSAVYSVIREAGGVCIADEVQTGYGRLGDVFYGFELQKVVPDIVVLGKPIGNGHPLAAVVTTRGIADAFDNGMEYFSTFGGNTVSCAVGAAVLEIVKRDDLQHHAQVVGRHLLKRFHQMKETFDHIGDVRGLGLFLGIELIRNPQSLEPATEVAGFISNRMRDRGILIGVDGPDHNVLKIRPPLPFSIKDANILVEQLKQCFMEVPHI